MTAYRVFPIDENGHVAGPPRVVECDSDNCAMGAARDVVCVHPEAEVWTGARRVGRVRHDHTGTEYADTEYRGTEYTRIAARGDGNEPGVQVEMAQRR